jgi:hypothetical protein
MSSSPQTPTTRNYAKEESGLDEDAQAVADHEGVCKVRKIERAEKKFAKENENSRKRENLLRAMTCSACGWAQWRMSCAAGEGARHGQGDT